ncbi:hypothetical protein B0H14DRAFT_3155597 [Mycena olivaceomarginata]|nr:hypothetical protein B0H14DRAFT_3155597 [Mycena olivaceomarginata]
MRGSAQNRKGGSAQHALPKSADRFPDGSKRGALPKKVDSLFVVEIDCPPFDNVHDIESRALSSGRPVGCLCHWSSTRSAALPASSIVLEAASAAFPSQVGEARLGRIAPLRNISDPDKDPDLFPTSTFQWPLRSHVYKASTRYVLVGLNARQAGLRRAIKSRKWNPKTGYGAPVAWISTPDVPSIFPSPDWIELYSEDALLDTIVGLPRKSYISPLAQYTLHRGVVAVDLKVKAQSPHHSWTVAGRWLAVPSAQIRGSDLTSGPNLPIEHWSSPFCRGALTPLLGTESKKHPLLLVNSLAQPAAMQVWSAPPTLCRAFIPVSQLGSTMHCVEQCLSSTCDLEPRLVLPGARLGEFPVVQASTKPGFNFPKNSFEKIKAARPVHPADPSWGRNLTDLYRGVAKWTWFSNATPYLGLWSVVQALLGYILSQPEGAIRVARPVLKYWFLRSMNYQHLSKHTERVLRSSVPAIEMAPSSGFGFPDPPSTPAPVTHLLSNAPPNSIETGLTTSYIGELESQIALLDDSPVSLQIRRADLVQSVKTHKAILSPIRRLPPEILGEVFSFILNTTFHFDPYPRFCPPLPSTLPGCLLASVSAGPPWH